MIIGAAVVNEYTSHCSCLSVVSSIAADGGGVDNIDIIDVSFTILKVLGFFGIMLVAAIFVIPKVVTPRLWKAKGSVEAIATASFFGAAAIAGSIGLSPIVGAFALVHYLRVFLFAFYNLSLWCCLSLCFFHRGLSLCSRLSL